ncbi:LEF-7 [Alphabaculovirus myunipunctae]|uniref:LEF-7 n=1 Tax=Mythimna unipuncta nucleopolyhedrovirus TaxID=447897 RepID=A0A2K9VS84_9ABAC|nr:LEF-7 [Mythimna unipuncta nucleopolyhedrovirus]AUV65300.1 LEF-7 [Mythimna unipuncta nucleopolyhedrovirus]
MISTTLKRSCDEMEDYEQPSKLQRTDDAQCMEIDESLVQKLPLDVKRNILEYLGAPIYSYITQDKFGTDMLMLKNNNLRMYFTSRPFNYVIEQDTALMRFFKNTNGAWIRLPLLAIQEFFAYFTSQPDDYDIYTDPMLRYFFPNVDFNILPDPTKFYDADGAKMVYDTILNFLKSANESIVECITCYYLTRKVHTLMTIQLIQYFYVFYKKNKLDLPNFWLPDNMKNWRNRADELKFGTCYLCRGNGVLYLRQICNVNLREDIQCIGNMICVSCNACLVYVFC